MTMRLGINYFIVLLLFIALSFISANHVYGNPVYKTKTLYVGESFSISPWNDLSGTPELSGGTCLSTICRSATPNTFVFEVTSTTTTNYYYDNLLCHGYYSTYRVTALCPGIFQVIGTATARRTKNGVIETGISNTVTYTVTVKEKPVVTAISIPGTLELTKGKSHTFSPVIVEEGANTTLTWTSSKPEVVSVTSAGVIKALAVGKSVITCTASNGVSAKCTVTVNPIVVTGVSINYSEIQINTGEKIDLTASVTPSNATNKDVTWSSSNPDIALVGLDGKVVGVNEGYCNIIATASDGSGKKSGCMVHVISQSFSGDVNKDGDVSVNDVIELINYLLNGGDNNHQFTVNGVSFNMIPIQGGTFTMGATAEQGDEAADKEKPAHQVTLTNYSIGETPVTQ